MVPHQRRQVIFDIGEPTSCEGIINLPENAIGGVDFEQDSVSIEALHFKVWQVQVLKIIEFAQNVIYGDLEVFINCLDLLPDSLQPILLHLELRSLFEHSCERIELLNTVLVDFGQSFLVLLLHFDIRINNIHHLLGSNVVTHNIFLLCKINDGSNDHLKE